MKTIWNVWAVHDMSPFGYLHRKVPGIRFYCDRALLLPSPVTVIHENGEGGELLDEYLAFLRRPEVAMGPNKVYRVRGDNLYDGMLADHDLILDMHRFVRGKGRVQLFCMTELAEDFFRKANLSQRDIEAAPLQVSKDMNDKARLREIGREAGVGHIFLDHEIKTDQTDIVRAVKRFLSDEHEAEFAVVKRTNLAGGEGIIFIRPGEDVETAIEMFLTVHGCDEKGARQKIMIEAGYRHVSYSTQLVFGDTKRPRFLGPMVQIVENGCHQGNTMAWKSSPGNPHPGIDDEDRIEMMSHSLSIGLWARERFHGWCGPVGFDFLKLRSNGRIVMSECNWRQTAATYPLAVSKQLEGRGLRQWGIVMLNGVATTSRSFGELEKKIGNDLMFDRVRGILPFNPRLMTLPDPHCGIIAVAETVGKALVMANEAKQRLKN